MPVWQPQIQLFNNLMRTPWTGSYGHCSGRRALHFAGLCTGLIDFRNCNINPLCVRVRSKLIKRHDKKKIGNFNTALYGFSQCTRAVCTCCSRGIVSVPIPSSTMAHCGRRTDEPPQNVFVINLFDGRVRRLYANRSHTNNAHTRPLR